jgi:hypothetical protein
MTAITEDYVSFEVAKLLKEKGFNEKCRGGYHSEFDDNDNPIIMLEEWTTQPYNNDFVDEGFLCSAPTHQMAMKWLREVYDIKIIIRPYVDGTYSYEILNGFWYVNFDSYENAVEESIKYCLKNLVK